MRKFKENGIASYKRKRFSFDYWTDLNTATESDNMNVSELARVRSEQADGL